MAAHLVRFRLSAIWVLCIALLVSGCVTTKRGGYTDKTDQNKAFETSLQLARSYIAQGNWDQAKRHLQFAESVDDNNPDTLEALALVFQNTGELETAESYYKRAIKQVPDRVRIRNNYAAFLFAQQRYAEAANQLEIVVEDLLYERRAEAFISLGRCYLQLDKLDKAENAFRRSLLMDNNNGSALLSMAEAVYRLERIAEAQRYYDAYRDKVKRQSAAGLWLGIRLADAFDDEDAFASYALALKNLYPKSEEFLKLKALQENRSQQCDQSQDKPMTQSKSSVAGPPGSVLREARESAGKSITETAEALNLLRTYVEALEQNDYSRFNSPLFARGYIKSYARYMGLDVDPLLKDCDRICRRDDEQFQRSKPQGRAKAPGNARVIVALIMATFIWSISYALLSGPVQKELAVHILEQRYNAPRSLRSSTALGESLLRGRDDGDGGLVSAKHPGQTDSHDVRLRLRAEDDVWFELRNVRGEILFSGTQAGGTVRHFDTQGPIELAAAYWPALKTQYNGQAVELPSPLPSNALRVRIGEL